MNFKRRALTNAAAAAVQVICVGMVLVLLYRFLYDQLGIESFGVWAVVLATASALSVAGLGLGTSVVKFVAQYMAREDYAQVVRIVKTATTSVAIVLGIALLAGYPLLQWVIERIIRPEAAIPEALLILPYALLAFWLITIGTVFQGALDGVHRVDLRAATIIVGQVLFLVLCWLWVPERGLLGVAQAQVIQGLTYCLGGWIVLRLSTSFLPLLPLGWSKATFKEIIGYGANYQVISLSTLLLDPVTKALLAKLGGVGLAGYYEMAYRMAFYLRSLIVTIHQALVPMLADLTERDPSQLPQVYRKSIHVIALLVALALPLLIASVPSISIIWLGELSQIFVLYAAIVLAAWFINTLSNPAYFAFLGEGYLRWNVIGHLIKGILNLGLGITLGVIIGGTGVVVAFAIAVIVGSTIVAASYQIRSAITLREVVQRQTIIIAALGSGLLLLSYLLHGYLNDLVGPWGVLGILLLAYAIVLAGPLLRHPLRHFVLDLVRARKQPAEERPQT
jgi:O-antigen/teichoic acid export membrane protein